MAGHSKFKNIQFRKGAQDKKRAKLFAKISKEITVAAKLGLPDPAANPRLRSAIALGRAQNMPKDNIERVIKKAESGENLNLEDFSLKVKKDFISTPVPQLKEDVNKEFYELSLAHYQRYIKPSFFT